MVHVPHDHSGWQLARGQLVVCQRGESPRQRAHAKLAGGGQVRRVAVTTLMVCAASARRCSMGAHALGFASGLQYVPQPSHVPRHGRRSPSHHGSCGARHCRQSRRRLPRPPVERHCRHAWHRAGVGVVGVGVHHQGQWAVAVGRCSVAGELCHWRHDPCALRPHPQQLHASDARGDPKTASVPTSWAPWPWPRGGTARSTPAASLPVTAGRGRQPHGGGARKGGEGKGRASTARQEATHRRERVCDVDRSRGGSSPAGGAFGGESFGERGERLLGLVFPPLPDLRVQPLSSSSRYQGREQGTPKELAVPPCSVPATPDTLRGRCWRPALQGCSQATTPSHHTS